MPHCANRVPRLIRYHFFRNLNSRLWTANLFRYQFSKCRMPILNICANSVPTVQIFQSRAAPQNTRKRRPRITWACNGRGRAPHAQSQTTSASNEQVAEWKPHPKRVPSNGELLGVFHLGALCVIVSGSGEQNSAQTLRGHVD